MDTKPSFEEWRPCVGFEGFYEVSNLGNVRSVDHFAKETVDTLGRKMPPRKMKGRIIRPRKHKFGYWIVTLSANNHRYTRTVHKLVAEAFYGLRENKDIVIRHLNGNCEDNRVENLRYGTQKENMQDAMKQGTVESGEKRYNAKFDNKTIKKIKKDLILGATTRQIQDKYGMPQSQVGKILAGRIWAKVGLLVTAPKKCVFLTNEQKKKVLELRNTGLTYKEIAKTFGCSKNQIFNIVKNHENHKD